MPGDACIGTVGDAGIWEHVAVLAQQLMDVKTTLPFVYFNATLDDGGHFFHTRVQVLGGHEDCPLRLCAEIAVYISISRGRLI